MAMFERSLFNKPVADTVQDVASGGYVTVFEIPVNKLGYLKRIEANNPSAGVMNLQIWDNYQDPSATALAAAGVTAPNVLASGFEKRKDIHIPANVEQINWDEDEDIPLLGEIQIYSDVSGVDATITARLM